MMSWFSDLKQYRDDHHKLVQLWHALDDLGPRFRAETQGLLQRDDEYQSLLGDYFFHSDELKAGIAEIETRRMINRAGRWRVPVRERPREEHKSSDYWKWHDLHGQYYLTESAMSELRRDVHQEWEMWSKPWLSWAAITISLFSLAVAIFKP